MKRDRFQNYQDECWNKVLDRALKDLPERQAPADLIAQVMSSLNTQTSRGWYKYLCWQWPLWSRITAGVLLPVLVVWVFLLGTRFYETRIGPVLVRSSEICRIVLDSVTVALGGILGGLHGVTLHIIFLVISLVLLGMYLTCIGVGTFIYRTVRR